MGPYLVTSVLAAYSEELTRVVRSIMHWWGGGSVIPTVLLPLGEVEGGIGVRLLYDLDAWILTSKMTASQTLAETRGILWEWIKVDNTAGTAESPGGVWWISRSASGIQEKSGLSFAHR